MTTRARGASPAQDDITGGELEMLWGAGVLAAFRNEMDDSIRDRHEAIVVTRHDDETAIAAQVAQQ